MKVQGVRKRLGFSWFVLAWCTLGCSSNSPKAKIAAEPLPTLHAMTAEPSVAPPVQDTHQPIPHRGSVLDHEAASIRARQVGQVAYSLWFDLTRRPSQDKPAAKSDGLFRGKTTITFALLPTARESTQRLFIDFEGGSVTSLTLNGTAVNDLAGSERVDGHRIYFQIDELDAATNRIDVEYTHPFSKSGNGFYEFLDPEDGRPYLFSNFEPYNAHQMFPCFDQPDLKASYEVKVEAPKDWEVIANTRERAIAVAGENKTWSFPPSPVFSTYLFALVAGPFASWKSTAGDIPLRLFARRSLAKYVEHDDWMKITRQGLAFYGTQFGMTYPFGKYDQIIVPDLTALAMENVGAITFSERLVSRTRVTEDRRRRRADVILHEMAHQWFGNLVTMRWWNGLWLNESFATLMAAWATDEATDFKSSWHNFFDRKAWAYWEDQLVTTHPIEVPVPDTAAAEANFDGITYGKGAATLKQLRFFLGKDNFRSGLQRYFQKYAYKNTTLDDFVQTLGDASGVDLSAWQRTWLQTPGVNTVKAEWACSEDPVTRKPVLSSFNLLQSPANVSSEIRPHRTQIAFFVPISGKGQAPPTLEPGKALDVAYSISSTPVKGALGRACPAFVFPNYEDYDYIKVDLDPVSLSALSTSLGAITDALTRQMVWHILWGHVIDGKLRAQDYAKLVFRHTKSEHNTLILTELTGNLFSSAGGHNTVVRLLEGDAKSAFRTEVESWAYANLMAAPPGSDEQLIWFRTYLDVASSSAATKVLQDLLAKKRQLKGLPMDRDYRWGAIVSLAAIGVDGIDRIISDELKNDPSDIGQKSAVAAEASIPNAANKSKWLAQITRKEGDLPFAKLRDAMTRFHLTGQEQWTEPAFEAYFSALSEFARSEDRMTEEYSGFFAVAMYPAVCNETVIQRTTKFLEDTPSLPAYVTRALKIHRQEAERCIRAQAVARSADDHSLGL